MSDLADAVNGALTSTIAHQTNGMLLRSVAIYEAIGADGQRHITVIPSEDARAWDVLGLLEYAKIRAGEWCGSESVDV